jgi:hypothetical protein
VAEVRRVGVRAGRGAGRRRAGARGADPDATRVRPAGRGDGPPHQLSADGDRQREESDRLGAHPGRDEQTVPPTAFEAGPAGLAIPVEVRIPADATETNDTNPRDSYRWRLDVTAAVPGLDYAESFDVPVFRTAASPEPAAHPAAPDVDAAVERPSDATILVHPSAGGGMGFRFPAARNPGAALGLTGFWLVWSGIVWFLVTHAAPLLFVVVFGLFDALLVMIVASLWLGTSRVVVEAGTVTARTSILGVGIRHRVPCTDVVAVEMPIGMQSGDGSGTPYYDLRLVRRDGSKMLVGRGVRSKREAEWLVGELRRAIGLSA